MVKYLLNRSIQILVTLVLFLTLTFVLVSAQPGDVAKLFVQRSGLPPEAIERLQRLFGLDKPLWQQYLLYMKNFLTGDFGVSLNLYPRSVMDVIGERLPRTLVLFLTASVISFYLGFLLGKIIAWRRGGLTEYASTLGGVTLHTMFTPWFALMMIWLFASKANWFPIAKFLDPLLWRDAPVDANHVFIRMLVTAALISVVIFVVSVVLSKTRFRRKSWVPPAGAALFFAVALIIWNFSGIGYLALDILKHMVLPVATLTLISFAGTMLLTRNSMIETMREDYVIAARAKGLPEKTIRDKHVARNALLPVVTSLVLSLAFAIDGSVIIEKVFSWPGMGMTLVDAASDKDIPLAVGALVFTGIFVLVAHLAADILYSFLDPRIRY